MFTHFKKYCDETTLHGFRYLTEGTVQPFQRTFWSIWLTLSFSGALALIYQLVADIRKTPIITVMSKDMVPISEIPFPAVTICSEASIHDNNVFYDILYPFYNGRNETLNKK